MFITKNIYNIITIRINRLVRKSREARIWREAWHLLMFALEDHKAIFTISNETIRT